MFTLYDKIDEIIYINLDRDVERRNRLVALLGKYFPDKRVTRMSAVGAVDIFDSRHIGVWSDRCRYLHDRAGKFDKKFSGVIGCYLSHYYALQYVRDKYAGQDKFVLILEDDCTFNDNIDSVFKSEFFFENIPELFYSIRPIIRNYHERDRINDVFYESSINGRYKYVDPTYYFSTILEVVNAKYINEFIGRIDAGYVHDFDGCTVSIPHVLFFKHDNSIGDDSLGGSRTRPFQDSYYKRLSGALRRIWRELFKRTA